MNHAEVYAKLRPLVGSAGPRAVLREMANLAFDQCMPLRDAGNESDANAWNDLAQTLYNVADTTNALLYLAEPKPGVKA